ncbi:MAG: RHS repeat protein [Gammaproteobacteria bacterium]|nr:RHS repeat protein [Gammaproteobacteria bacterium]
MDAFGPTTTTQYNALGLRTVITDANGAAIFYEYDRLNRPLTITYTADNQTVSYEYNALGGRLVMTDTIGVNHPKRLTIDYIGPI